MASQPAVDFSRRESNRMVAGVAGGIADSLGVPDGYVRAAFLTLATVWGLGVVLYAVLWIVRLDRVEDREPATIEPNQQLGLAFGFLGLMTLMAVLGWWPNPALVLTAGGLAFGTAALTDASKPGPLAALLDPNVETASRIRLVVGAGLLIAGLTMFGSTVGEVFEVGIVFTAVALTGLGIFIALGPWVRRLLSDLGEERAERARQEERAEMAAHLHDSVLQTLALIQRSGDPARMAILARHQESELRDWLYGSSPLDGADLTSTALKSAAARVEEAHQVPIEVVTVGDHPFGGPSTALVGAASEAMVNAAKHSGADQVSLYFEAEPAELVVYVTDQGRGFDTSAEQFQGKGIDNSIKSRIERAGGTVEIVSEPGEGTEVVLKVPKETDK
ncbi:MAG: PspC domain-containing protein [Acidimicrobiia bacterium]|nr:PspC domain-containing protein [Acidimicrobiia bacterium]